MKKLGVYFGTFAPMHLGHVSVVTRMSRECDRALIVVSGYDDDNLDRGAKIGLGVSKRFRYVRELYAGGKTNLDTIQSYNPLDPIVRVAKLNEEGIPKYPNGWEEWSLRLDNLISDNISKWKDIVFDKIVFYVGEEEYVSQLKKLFPESDVVLLERSNVDISASKIRENPYEYWNYITKPFQRHFAKKVCIVGTASGGKTTLVKDLARLFNAPYSLEFARKYQLESNVADDELDKMDYMSLFLRQYTQTSDIIDSGNHNGIIFADTNSTVTMAYAEYYLKGNIPEEDYKLLESMYRGIVSAEKWDLILYVTNGSEYVDDGFRDMSMSDDTTRNEFNQLMYNMFKEQFPDKLHVLKSTNKDTFFIDNFNQAKELIEVELGYRIGGRRV